MGNPQLIQVPVHYEQLPHFRRQSSMFFARLKAETGYVTKKANRLNLFAKICGYSSFATLKMQGSQGNSTTAPLFLTDTDEKFEALRCNIVELGFLSDVIEEFGEKVVQEVIDGILSSLPVP